MALLLTGLLGSLGHCLGMCGPLVMLAGLQLAGGRGRPAMSGLLLYHGARIGAYAALGLVAGGVGSLLKLGPQLSRFGGAACLALGVGVLLLGLGYVGWLPLGRLEASGEWVGRAMRTTLKRRGAAGIALLGFLNGLLPCCLVYGALLAAASTGRPLSAALAMLLFGAGTLPALLLLGMGAAALGTRARLVLTRASGALIALIGTQLALRGAAGIGIQPSVRLGPVVLW